MATETSTRAVAGHGVGPESATSRTVPNMPDFSEDVRLYALISRFTKKQLDECLGNLSISKSGNKRACQMRLWDACGIHTSKYRPHVEHDRYVQQRAREEVWERVGGKEVGTTSNGNKPVASSSDKPRGEVKCLCGNSKGGNTIQCSITGCHKLQHLQCVGLSLIAGDKVDFVCETCRLALTDPFQEASVNKMTAKLIPTGAFVQGSKDPVIGVDRMLKLDASEKKAIDSGELSLIVSCMMLDDTTNYRYHWPLKADLRINNVPYRVVSRSLSTKLGVNGRDHSFSVGRYCYTGSNRVVLTGVDSRPFVLMVFLTRPRSVEQVKSLMHPKESIEQSYKRMLRLVNGRSEDEQPEDADDDIVTLSTVISLKCPLTGSRIKTPVRFSNVNTAYVFDLDAFLDMAKKTYKWQCPHTMTDSSIEKLQIDSYTERILQMLEHTSYNEVEISPEAMWRPAGTDQEFRDILEDPATAKPIEAEPVKEETLVSSDDEDDNIISEKEAQAIRSAPKVEEDDVIVIDSDDDDDNAMQPFALNNVSSTQGGLGRGSGNSGRGGMRITLPSRNYAAACGPSNTSSIRAQLANGGQLQQQREPSNILSMSSPDIGDVFECFVQQQQLQPNTGYTQQQFEMQQQQHAPHLVMGQQAASNSYLSIGQQQQQQQQLQQLSGIGGPSMSMSRQVNQYENQQGFGVFQNIDSMYPQLMGTDTSQASTTSAAYGLSQNSSLGLADIPSCSQALYTQNNSEVEDFNEVVRNDMTDFMDFMVNLDDADFASRLPSVAF